MLRKIICSTLCVLFCFTSNTNAQINVNANTAYTENFDGMGATTTLPANWRMAEKTVTPIWNMGVAAVTEQSSSGSPTTGGTYNWGQNGATERAVGAMTSGTFASPNSLMACYRNTNVWPITQLSISYNAERYRVNSAMASIQFYYSLDGTNWNPVAAGDVAETSFPTGASSYAFASPLTINVGAFNITGINIPASSSFYLRWNFNTTGTNSQGIGIDDVSVTPTFTTLTTNISGGGVNWVGANQGYTQPVNCNGSSPFVMKYRRLATTANAPTDGRGQWFTTLNAQSTGGDVTLQDMGGGGGNGFLFTNEGNCGVTGGYINKWVFSGVGQGGINQINGNVFNGSNDMGFDMSTPGYYSFAFRDAGYTSSSFYVGYTSSSPVSIFNSTATLNNDYSVTVNATLSASPSAQERFYIRYRVGSNDFTSGTSIIEGSGSGSNRTFIIPTQTVGSTIYYYLFSSTLSLTTLNALSEGDRSLACLQYADNNNSNFSFTIPTPTTYTWNATATASWTNSSSWSPVGVPTNGDNVVFNNAAAVTVTNVPNISLRSLVFSGTGQVAWQSSQNVVVNVGFSGAPNPVVQINTGKYLSLSSSASNTISLVVKNGFSATVFGTISFSNAAHRLIAENSNAISFENGSLFIANTGFGGNPFGTSGEAFPGTNSGVIFKNGATYEYYVGSSPFGADGSEFRAVFQAGSLYRHKSGNSFASRNRTYANVEYDFNGSSGSINASAGSLVLDNLSVLQGTLNLNLAGSPGHSIRGNIHVNTTAILSLNPSSLGTVLINGGGIQSLSGGGTIVTGTNSIIEVVSGTSLYTGNMVVSGTGTFTLQSGGTLGIGSAYGITTAGNAQGNIQTSTRNFNAGGNYVYNGNLNQQTGNGLPSNITGSLTIANTGTAGNNTVTLTANNTSTNALNLNSGLFAAGAGQTLEINNTGSVTSIGGEVVTTAGGGNIWLKGNNTVTGYAQGTPHFYDISIGSGIAGSPVTLTNNPTVHHYCTLNSQAAFNGIAAPTYATGSTLIYNTTGTYNRGIEWGSAAGNPGYPWHVMVQNGTTVQLGIGGTPTVLETGGNLNLGNGTTTGFVNMNALAQTLTVKGNLTIGDGTTVNNALTLSTAIGGDLVVHGNFTRYDGSFYNDNSRAIFFRGSGNSTISIPGLIPPAAGSPNPTLQDYGYTIIDKDVATAKVILNAPVGVTEKLTLTRGIIAATSHGLFIKKPSPDATNEGIAGGSIDSYVDGRLYRYMSVTTNGLYSFPIGKSDVGSGAFKPVVFTTTNHLSPGAVFSAEYFGGVNATPLYGPDENFLGTLQGVLRDEFWQFNKVSGAAAAAGKLAVKYDYNAGNVFRDADNNVVPVCADCNVAVVKRDSDLGVGNWEFTKADYTFDVYDATYPEARLFSQSGFIQSGELSSFSPFTVGFNFNNILGTLPVKLLSFDGQLQQQQAKLTWTIDSDKDVRHFELQHSTDGSSFTSVRKMQPAGNSYSIAHQPYSSGKQFYRLKVVEKNGTSFYSKTVLLITGNSSSYMMGLQSTIVQQQAVINLWSAQNQAAQTSLYDASGKLLAQQQQQILRGDNQLKVTTQHLAQGIYFLHVYTADGIRQTLRFIKE